VKSRESPSNVKSAPRKRAANAGGGVLTEVFGKWLLIRVAGAAIAGAAQAEPSTTPLNRERPRYWSGRSGTWQSGRCRVLEKVVAHSARRDNY